MTTCEHCKQKLDIDEVVQFDEFGSLENPMIICKLCFKKIIEKGVPNFDPGKCETCNKTLVPHIDDWDDVFKEKLIWFMCPEAIKNPELSDHEQIGYYIVQPPDDSEPTWNG
ncbi:hypothetical protein ACJ2A9_21885 [Anaerobacillus sp. MEB173]|uniref:hypothetical protein n=1 Tax=Anaerobacillus sp. MEB173 TaxID=3383345 RepID=UPI003F8F881B